ncbi:MAG: ABC transporter permease [Saccharofermentans sp.]|nr:ABC transporter permease [Saccharofermentans sp.]
MNIILKNLLKNVFCKPFRTLLVVFSIFVCSFCAMLCFDLVTSIKDVVADLYGDLIQGDIVAMIDGYSAKGLPDGFPEADIMQINSNSEQLYKDIPGEYAYVTSEYMNIYGIDIEQAIHMELLEPDVALDDYETLIAYKFSESYGYKVGDKLVVHDRAGDEHELTVVGILPQGSTNILLSGNKALVNMSTADVLSCGRNDVGVLMIDILDDSSCEEAARMLEEYYPDGTVVNMALTDEEMESIDELAAFLYLLFAVTFLLVIFVTASICNRIVSERMSFIGTLRSLGMNTARTGSILLLENVFYAVVGSIPAVILYTLIRKPFFDLLFYAYDANGNPIPYHVRPISVFLIIGVVIGAAAIECLIPLKAILKALRTSIRDIIFDNRDTEYKYSKFGLVTGLVLLAGTIGSFFFRQSFFGATICLLCTVTSLAFLFPWIFKGIVTLINRAATKSGNARWMLASIEAMSRKSTVSSGVLCVTAAAMSVVVFTFAQSTIDMMGGYNFSSDVIISCNDKMKAFTFVDKLDGVTDTEAIYERPMYITVNGSEKEEYADFYAMPDGGEFKYYEFFDKVPDSLEEGSILVDDRYAAKNGINPGDNITIVYDHDGVVPIEREYKVAGLVGIMSFDGTTGTFILTKQEFKEIFRDEIGYFLIKCDDPDYVRNMIETYAVGSGISGVRTFAEYKESFDRDTAQLTTIMAVIIVIAVGMTFIGMASNQLIGFEGRKKECAVMLSTAMGKGKLSGILFLEMLITSFIASLMGTATGLFLSNVIGAATENAEGLFLVIKTDPVKSILFGIILILVFAGTVLFPIKNLRKMKISEQLKYE